MFKQDITSKTTDAAVSQALLKVIESEDAETYDLWLKRAERLSVLRESNAKNRVSRDTLAVVGGNITIAAMIIGFERAHIVTSKALGLFLKMR